LMARGGMRIGEVLKLRLKDLQDRKLILHEPESGKEHDFAFILLCRRIIDSERLKISYPAIPPHGYPAKPC
jgi:integrase